MIIMKMIMMINPSKSARKYKLQSINKVYSNLFAHSKARISKLPRCAVLPDCFRAIDFAVQQLKMRYVCHLFIFICIR